MSDFFIIGDSGSTKTHWAIVNQEKLIYTFQTIGLNPLFVESKTISEQLQEQLKLQKIPNHKITQCYFYGAGCNSMDRIEIVRAGLQHVLKDCKIEIESDLLGAARAIFGNELGVIGILGTGSNAALYDGKGFTQKAFSLGYVLGDEGSGNHLGKSLIVDFIRKKMPAQLLIDFKKTYNLSLEDAIANVYKESFPNRYLASYAIFASKHQNHEYIKALLTNSFSNFIEEQVLNLDFDPTIQIGLIGSVAYHFKEVVTQTFNNYNLNLHKIEQSPMKGLIDFHTSC